MTALTPEAVAAGLTSVQRKAIMGLAARGSIKPQLVRAGLLYLKPKIHAAWAKSQSYTYELTPLGLQVRALLQADPRP